MTVASESDGSQTATISTEHDLATPTTAKTRVLCVDLNALVAGDVVELCVYLKVRPSGTERRAHRAVFSGPVDAPSSVSPPFPMVRGGRFSLKQTAGTGRAFPWEVLTLD